MLVLPLLLSLLGCSVGNALPEHLEPASKLKGGCYDKYTVDDHARVGTPLRSGQNAIEFELKTPAGEAVRLSELLATKPVVVHTGSYTCDRYQGKEKAIGKFSKMFADDVHTVVVYTTEAHPKTDPSPYRGRVWKRPFSDRDQPTDWEQRAEFAGDLELPKTVTVLIDEMDDPFWCTYGTCPNCSFLIAPDGKLEAVHKWHDPKTMIESTRALLNRLKKEG